MVRTVGVHNCETLHPFALGTTLGDVGDAAVEKRRFAGQFRIDRVGTFMRSTAPVPRRHIEAKPGDFVAVADIIKITANGQITVAAYADKALDQLLNVAAFPVIELWSCNFGKCDVAHTARAAGFEHARCTKVG